MALPTINIVTSNTLTTFQKTGAILNKYSPFYNLKTDSGEYRISSLRLSSGKAKINITAPLEVSVEASYDGSANIIINDKSNPIKLVNSRFYLTSSTTYKVSDIDGNVDSNIYTEDNFSIQAGLIKVSNKITSVDFLGVYNGGKMRVGNYTFYFKLADSDGNETDFIAESGKIVCYIGGVNQPTSIRGGQMEEDSSKIIKFRLNNLDLSYNYINVYYTRSSGDGENSYTKTYRLGDKIKISGISTEISITGYENHYETSQLDINMQYTRFEAVESQEVCQNIAFAGGVTKNYEVYKTLEKYSLLITPEITHEETIGNLSHNYVDYSAVNKNEYYNPLNIYYRLGYWDEEIYRFGIVYIMNDYSLSPVFNIRGARSLSQDTVFKSFNIGDSISYGNNYIIQGTDNENSKGVLKIFSNEQDVYSVSGIRPIGLKFNFTGNVIDGTDSKAGLSTLTKGFFIVRQKRIPTIISQGISIGTSEKGNIPTLFGNTSENSGYIGESFLESFAGKPKLGRSLYLIDKVRKNALLCPEADLRTSILNGFFNSSEYFLKKSKYTRDGGFVDYSYNRDGKLFSLGTPSWKEQESGISANVLLVEPGIEGINNIDTKFSSKAGEALVPHKYIDPVLGDVTDLGSDASEDEFSLGVTKTRGIFNRYLGVSTELDKGSTYNIFQKDYNFDLYWGDYFKVRYNDASPYMPISNRIPWEDSLGTISTYRGDCYINTYTHRMLWNFIDPDLPTNKKIVDPWTWYRNFRVKGTSIKSSLLANALEEFTGEADISDKVRYNKILPLFTWKEDTPAGESSDEVLSGLITSQGRRFKKYSEINGSYGSDRINRPDVNAVGIGHWASFKICSNINLALRDLDMQNPAEEAIHKRKRGFYPLYKLDSELSLPDSGIINNGISSTLGDKYYFGIPEVPFIKTSFTNRIHYSNPIQNTAIQNGNRLFQATNYQDYTLEYGKIIKIIDWYGALLTIFEHGLALIPVNERAMMTSSSGDDVAINAEKVLPKNPRILSSSFGSIWPDSIIKTSRFVYGLDTIGKKVWRTNGESLEIISDMKIQKFLNDFIQLKGSDRNSEIFEYSIKTHYNAFKGDVMFVFKYGETKWNLCWNELLNKWITKYTWFPEFSENIDNIFYTFANESIHTTAGNVLYKHGFAGVSGLSEEINPTNWYGETLPFEFEFVVVGSQGIQKIFNNLKIISNRTKPTEFYYEVVGEGFDWKGSKDTISTFTTQTEFDTYLRTNSLPKLPYIFNNPNFTTTNRASNILKDVTLRKDSKSKESSVLSFQKGNDISTQGRLRGNMNYVEDSWDVQIQPISFKYVYINKAGDLAFSQTSEMRIRDKYIKIRIKYDGTQYAFINAIKTMFTISYA